jgi:hypothetical protein
MMKTCLVLLSPTSFPNPNLLGATWNMTLVHIIFVSQHAHTHVPPPPPARRPQVHDMAAVIGLELRALWLQGVGENHANDLPHLGLVRVACVCHGLTLCLFDQLSSDWIFHVSL